MGMVLDEILNLPSAKDARLKVRDVVARDLNSLYEQGERDAVIFAAAILVFRVPTQRITSSTEDLLKCLVPELINFPPYGDREYAKIKKEADFWACIFKPASASS